MKESPETHVQAVACAVLDELGLMACEDAEDAGAPLPEDDPGLLWFHPPNEALNRQEAGAASWKRGTRPTKEQQASMLYGQFLVGQGVKKGVPDVIICQPPPAFPECPGVVDELKSDIGSARPEQKMWLAALKRRGWDVGCSKGVGAFLERFRRLGWDVDRAVARLAKRGVLIANGRLVQSENAAELRAQSAAAARERKLAREVRGGKVGVGVAATAARVGAR